MGIPKIVEAKLNNEVWQRVSQAGITAALGELGISQESDFAEFYKTYNGPFRSKEVGYELLDLISQNESILSNTRAVREEFEFPKDFIVITAYFANAVLVLSSKSDKVYDVDFEGGDRMLSRGELPERWKSWNDFIVQYFG